MPCYRPITAYRSTSPYGPRHEKTGKPVLRLTYDPGELLLPVGKISLYEERMRLPCGSCDGCRLKRSSEWASRIMHEARYHKASSFLTLTYSTEQLPPNGTLDKTHFQGFMKRLRERLRVRGHAKLKYYMCGEYGDQRERPHYHAILFGFFPENKRSYGGRKVYKTTPHDNNPGAANPIWRSEFLEELWCDEKGKSLGRVLVGHVTEQSAAYVARYTMKKLHGQAAEEVYAETERIPPYTAMSKGIGARYFAEFQAEIYNNDSVMCENGLQDSPVPRYYDKLKAKYEADPAAKPVNTKSIESVKRRRSEKAAAMNPRDMTPERLAVREEVVKLRVKRLRRSYEEHQDDRQHPRR